MFKLHTPEPWVSNVHWGKRYLRWSLDLDFTEASLQRHTYMARSSILPESGHLCRLDLLVSTFWVLCSERFVGLIPAFFAASQPPASWSVVSYQTRRPPDLMVEHLASNLIDSSILTCVRKPSFPVNIRECLP